MQALKVGLKREKIRILLGKGCWQSEDGRMGERKRRKVVGYTYNKERKDDSCIQK